MIFEGLLKIFEHSGKQLKKIKKKKRKKKIQFKVEEEMAEKALVHLGSLELKENFQISFPDKINFNICEFFFKLLEGLLGVIKNVRLQSLIENLVEFKNSNWEVLY